MIQVHHLWSLVKPRIVTLLCVTGVFSLLAAGGGSLWLLVSFSCAGACIAASSATFNCWYDRELDRNMERTADRPLPSGQLDHRVAAAFGLFLLGVGTTIGVLALPLVSVGFMWLGVAAYVGLYTVLLKRRHWLGVVLGGSAGSFPVLAGWTAVRPLEIEAAILALVVFVWTPAHAWALAYVYRADFARADIPTLPVVASEQRVRRWVWISAWSTVAVAVAGVPFTDPPYGVTAIVGGALFLLGYHQFRREGTEPAAVRAFFTSNLYLALLFVAWGIGGTVDGWDLGFQAIAGAALPLLFTGLWAAQPSLRGVPGATGNGWRETARRPITRFWTRLADIFDG